MARRRMIDPGIWDDPDFGDLSMAERLFYIGCFSNADDEGRLIGDPRYLAKTIFGYDGLLADEVRAIRERVCAMFSSLKLYIVNGKDYLYFENWRAHQSISHPTPSHLPSPDEPCQNDSGTIPEPCQNDSGTIPTQYSIDKYSIDKSSLSEIKGADAPTHATGTKLRANALRAKRDVIQQLADAFVEGKGWEQSRVVQATVHSSWAPYLLAIHEAGYTPDEVRNCTTYKRSEPYWHDKDPPLKVIAEFLPEWKRLGEPPMFVAKQEAASGTARKRDEQDNALEVPISDFANIGETFRVS